MYFVKARKHFEDPDSNETSEKGKRDRYQRSDSARLLLQALPTVSAPQQPKNDEPKVPIQLPDTKRRFQIESSVDANDFKLEELPDAVCYRPKKDLPSVSTTSSINSQSVTSGGLTSSNLEVKRADSLETGEHVRPAEYIGTFSVSGSDKEARERQMESQLEQMRSARDSRAVSLVISNNGVKVILKENNNVFMDHSLKRIWYATCDPEYCQFSFLAREPKTSAEVQYCHAFVTDTPEQAEELISIIGEAFKSTYQQGKKQPTFHELIEQQVQEQQAKFREIEKEAKNALQKKLKEIATPTPFSEKAQSRMERRRQSDEVEVVAADKKNWAKLQVEGGGVTHASFTDRNYNSSSASAAANRRSEIPTRQSTPLSSPFKRNSVPPQVSLSSSIVPSSTPPHPLSAMAIKESLETRNSNSKFKGSPVTALKNEIDRRLPMSNGADVHPVLEHRDFLLEQKKQQNVMANRPLPQPPAHSASPHRSQHQRGVQQSPQRLQQRSLDDYHLPRSSSSQIPLSSSASKGVASSGNVKLRDSPRRKQPRPHSEIATSSSGAAGSGAPGGNSFYEQQRQSLLNNFAASFNLPPHVEGGSDGMYIYGPPPPGDSQHPHGDEENRYQHQEQSRGRDLNRRAESGGRASADTRPRREDPGPRPTSSSQAPNRFQGGQPGNIGPRAKSPRSGSQGRPEPVVPRYQNDSPFQNDGPDKGSKQQAGFESLMCLDRSHIHDEALRNASWYQAGLPREIALEILQQEDVGSFIVRDSSTHPGCYALSVRVPKYENSTGISHYLILRTHRGVKLKGLDKEWSTLTALVTHHTVMREMLPCTLKLPKSKGQGAAAGRSVEGGGEERGSADADNYHPIVDMAGPMGKLKM